MRSTVLTDDDVRRVLPMSAAVDRIESALREHAEGTIVVAACNRNGPGLQSVRFPAHITCLYPSPPAHITCL